MGRGREKGEGRGRTPCPRALLPAPSAPPLQAKKPGFAHASAVTFSEKV